MSASRRCRVWPGPCSRRPTQIGLGDLSGNYGGATAGGAFVIGAGANVMYGGSNNSFALQPLSLEGQVGLNVYAGVAGLELRFGQ